MPKTIDGIVTMSVEEAARQLGIGRTLAYELAKRGELPGVLRLGRRFVVTKPRFNAAIGAAADSAPVLDVDEGPQAA